MYTDHNGAPAALLQSATVNDPSTSFDNASGFFLADFPIAPLPVFASTTYWLELHAGSSLTDTAGFTVSWAAADDNAARIAVDNLSLGTPDSPVAINGFNQYAFELSGTAAPEPSERVVLAAAALLAAYLKLRKRKAAANR